MMNMAIPKRMLLRSSGETCVVGAMVDTISGGQAERRFGLWEIDCFLGGRLRRQNSRSEDSGRSYVLHIKRSTLRAEIRGFLAAVAEWRCETVGEHGWSRLASLTHETFVEAISYLAQAA